MKYPGASEVLSCLMEIKKLLRVLPHSPGAINVAATPTHIPYYFVNPHKAGSFSR